MKTPLCAFPLPIFALTLVTLLALPACKDKIQQDEVSATAAATDTKPVKKSSQKNPPSSNELPPAATDPALANIPAELAARYNAALHANDATALLELGKQTRVSASSNNTTPDSETAPDLAQFAALCFTQAARLGNTDAMLLAARCALEGLGPNATRQTALNLYIAAGEAGETAGYNAAARILLDGKDASPDVPAALALIDKAIALGSHEAQFLKGTLLLAQGGDAATEAMSLLMEAARADNADAQLLLAKLYREGKYVPLDEAAAAEWSKYAADLGLASANADYARLTLHGKSGADGDVRTAIDRLVYAAGQGNASAAMQLAHIFQSVRNPTAEDFATATRYAQLAYENGEPDASLMLAILALRTNDPDTALDWLEKEANWTNWRTKYAYDLMNNKGLTLQEATLAATRAKREDALATNAEKLNTTNTAGDAMPVVITAPEPQIPPSLTSLDATISTKVQFVVDKNGTPTDIKLLTPTPYAELDQSIIDALTQWRFKPGTKNGQPVYTRMQLPLNINTKR